MLDNLAVVAVTTGVELLPDGSHDGSPAKSVFLHFLYVMHIDASQRIDLLVDDALLVRLLISSGEYWAL